MLRVDQIACHYHDEAVLKGLSFHIGEGDICCLLGPSGCGKTTALRAIAGLQPISAGEIRLGDHILSSPSVQVPPERRQIGMVFQDYALFPNMTVRDNIAFGIRKMESQKQQRTIDELLELVRLTGTEERYPHEISGGQQQRVALARALATNPELLLLDEPFSNLDVELRKRLSVEVRDILKEYGTSAILVTHDQEEAFTFGDHIGLLHNGTLQQWDTPFNLYHEPCNRFVADFIGRGRFIPGLLAEPSVITTEMGPLTGNRAYPWSKDTSVDVLLRPDDIALAEGEGIPATVAKKIFYGSSTLYTLQLLTGSMVDALLPSHCDFALDEQISIEVAIEHLIAFRRDE